MMQWRHLFKLDPDRYLDSDVLDELCTSGSDAIVIGGSTGVTYEATARLLEQVRRHDVPCVLEVSDPNAIVPGFDLYFIPMVLNTTDVRYLIAQHARAIEQCGMFIPWQRVCAEGYIILNPNATAARLTRANTQLDDEAVCAYAKVADRLCHLPIVYIEYSGVFGNMELLQRVREQLDGARLFYGGGIVDECTAAKAACLAHTICVGNIIYSDPKAALTTVNAAKKNVIL